MDAFEHCRMLVAQADKERYWASLYAPAERRGGLHALYAFDIETGAVRHRVRDPMAGEIRLQWWREVVEGGRAEEAAANPVAAALRDTTTRHALPADRLIALIDARAGDLVEEPAGDFEDYAAATAGSIFALAAQVLGEEGPDIEHLSRHAGLATLSAAAGRGAEARAQLDAAAALLPQIAQVALPAFLPAATIRPSLARQTPLPLWRRQWLVWGAARDPKRIFG